MNMTLNMFDLITRLALLFILGIASDMSLHKGLLRLTAFLFAVWLNLYRLTVVRAIDNYSGVFGTQWTKEMSANASNIFTSPPVTVINYLLMLITGLALLTWLYSGHLKLKE